MIKVASAEENFLDYMQSLKRHTKGRSGAIIHISTLSPTTKTQNTRELLLNLAGPIDRKFEGQIFALENHDIVLLYKDISSSDINDYFLRIKYLLSEDDLFQRFETLDRSEDLYSIYSLEKHYDTLLKEAKKYCHTPERITGPDLPKATPSSNIEEDIKKQVDADINAPSKDDQPASTSGKLKKKTGQTSNRITGGIKRNLRYFEIVSPKPKPLAPRNFSAADLAKIESALKGVDITNLITRQDIELITPQGEKQPVFIDRYIPLKTIQERLLPSCDLHSDPWLAGWLREFIDTKILEQIDDFDSGRQKNMISTCVRVNVATCSSKKFDQFHNRCASGRDHRIILEFAIHDILNNIGNYLVVRKKLLDLRYRICIGRLTPYAYITCDRAKLGADFEKITWDPHFNKVYDGLWFEALKEEITKRPSYTTILCNAYDDDAIAFGHDVGIHLFQSEQAT